MPWVLMLDQLQIAILIYWTKIEKEEHVHCVFTLVKHTLKNDGAQANKFLFELAAVSNE